MNHCFMYIFCVVDAKQQTLASGHLFLSPSGLRRVVSHPFSLAGTRRVTNKRERTAERRRFQHGGRH